MAYLKGAILLAWMSYFLSSAVIFGVVTWWPFHQPSNIAPLRYVIPFQFFVQLILAVLISWFVGKALLNPLAAMSQSARQIASGDLNFSLPASQVREVAEVAAAF